jgi:hypothetical protein
VSNDVDANWQLPAELVRQSDHQAWRLARAGKVTASNFRRVMEAKTPRALRTLAREIADDLAAVRRQELTSKLDGVAAIMWGKEHEAEARALYTLESGNDVEDGGFHVWSGHPLVGASPDGLTGADGLIEIKCPFSREQHHTYGNGPGNALWQVQGQLLCTGRQWADFVSFDPRERPGMQLFVTRVERDEALLVGMGERLVMFADEFLAPALDFMEVAA